MRAAACFIGWLFVLFGGGEPLKQPVLLHAEPDADAVGLLGKGAVVEFDDAEAPEGWRSVIVRGFVRSEASEAESLSAVLKLAQQQSASEPVYLEGIDTRKVVPWRASAHGDGARIRIEVEARNRADMVFDQVEADVVFLDRRGREFRSTVARRRESQPWAPGRDTRFDCEVIFSKEELRLFHKQRVRVRYRLPDR